MRIIGDVHGKFCQYANIIAGTDDATVQVGDFGVGFMRRDGHMTRPPTELMHSKDRFIRGNHDNPGACRGIKNHYIEDGTIEGGIMFIGGAYSPDIHLRTEGVNWWRDEELSYQQFERIFEDYVKARPDVMITHDCPNSVMRLLFNVSYAASRTRSALESMWDDYKPSLWVFGHHHQSRDMEVKGTRFVCLNELEYRDFADF